ncbi:aspartic peptidase domain-containing protein [Massariosphaeria phaeospora]|uniref:Aspartic peptidase domain-containing protein n=1 Tax=Massariosphaeria phaeospora TaxID=100035 RepID=A0A7C8I7J2_9PLEO|nr:aspartic peptidase domain-containing protein [Massariosphaeria phaeospora]
MVAVKIGSSDKEYHFVLDSASSSTWVMADDCEAEPCSLHTTFGPDDSDSLKVDGTPWSVTYGSGTASGITATDTLRIAGLSPTLSINLATNVSTEFRTQPFDGLLGLGRDETLTSDSSPQLLTVLAASKLIPAKLYGIHFSRHADGVHDGELNLGAPNPARYDGELNYIPCVAETAGFWEVALDDAGVGASLVNFGPRTAIMDTGTSFIMMPLADASALHDLVRGSTNSGETFEVPCDTAAEIQFVLGGTTYGISTKDWVGGPLANGMCKSNVIGRQAFTADTQWLVGDVFLKNVYAVYDYEENRMGFGTKGGKGVEGEQVQSSVAAPSGTATAGGKSTFCYMHSFIRSRGCSVC